MAAKAEDRRIQRTRALLLSALLDLIVERGYEDVSVQDIVDRANVGRSTFYKHFLDKRELLLSGVDGLQELLTQQRAALDTSEAARAPLLGFSLPLFQHVQSNLRFCRALLGPRSGAIVEPRVQRILADLVQEELAACVPAGAVLAGGACCLCTRRCRASSPTRRGRAVYGQRLPRATIAVSRSIEP